MRNNGASTGMPEPAGRRTRGIFDPADTAPYRLSRSKLELFVQCARCFHLDRKSGIARPEGAGFSLQHTVDLLLKREFDLLREQGEPHALMRSHGIDAIPLRHPSLDEWRDTMRGVRYLHTPTNFLVTGAVDDLWVNPAGRIHVVDYKTTSSDYTPSLGGRFGGGYKRQAEVYQWLLRSLGYDVSPTAYFVYANADRGRESFDGRLEFTTTVLPYEGSSGWVEDALKEARLCLERSLPPPANPGCEWCAYREAAGTVEMVDAAFEG